MNLKKTIERAIAKWVRHDIPNYGYPFNESLGRLAKELKDEIQKKFVVLRKK